MDEYDADLDDDELDTTVDDTVEVAVELDRRALTAALDANDAVHVALDTPADLELEMNDQLSIAGSVVTERLPGEPVFGDATIQLQITDPVVSTTVTEDLALTGFTATGESDGKFELQVNSMRRATDFATRASPLAGGELPTPIPLEDGDTVTVQATNVGTESGLYEATLYLRERQA